MKGSAKALKSGRKYIWSILKWILMLAFAIYTLFPLLWLFITSFKTNAEYFDSPFSLPAVPQFSNYINAISQANLGQMIINSITVAVIATILNVLIAAIILISGLGFNSIGGITFHVASASITLSGLAVAAILGILLNAIFPGNDYEFSEEEFTENAVRDEVGEIVG